MNKLPQLKSGTADVKLVFQLVKYKNVTVLFSII